MHVVTQKMHATLMYSQKKEKGPKSRNSLQSIRTMYQIPNKEMRVRSLSLTDGPYCQNSYDEIANRCIQNNRAGIAFVSA